MSLERWDNFPKQNLLETKTVDTKRWHITVSPKQELINNFYGDF